MPIEIGITKRLGKSFRLAADFTTGTGCPTDSDCPGIFGILGPSGGGKSVLLRCIAGIETPDHGRIAINGRPVFDNGLSIAIRPQQRRVGYLFQNYALFPTMTVAENIASGIARPGNEKTRIVDDLVHRFQLGGMERQYPHQLSGGQQQRTALARMLAAEPEVILLDEPFSALDDHLREHMRVQLLDMLGNRQDVVMVTHNRDDAFDLCSDIMVLDKGRILARGSPEQLIANPGHVVVARTTGCKNLSRMEKLSPLTVRAVDWGLILTAASPIPDDATYVGIHAHAIEPAGGLASFTENVVEVRVRKRLEGLAEENVIFSSASRDTTSSTGELWWRRDTRGGTSLPARLRLPPEALLFLRDD